MPDDAVRRKYLPQLAGTTSIVADVAAPAPTSDGPTRLNKYPAARTQGDDNYCPYCNRSSRPEMTIEHIIPESIGGDGRTTIRVCRECNSGAGGSLDARLARFTSLRMLGRLVGSLMNHHEKHESRGTLKDGRQLDGYFKWVRRPDGGVDPGFTPRRTQGDGSVWVPEEACADPSKLPASHNVYRHEMLDMSSVYCEYPDKAGIEPSMIKVLLGIMYVAHGRGIVSGPGFDLMRQCLHGQLPPQVKCRWAESVDALPRELHPEMKDKEHTIWGGSPDGRKFTGGVRITNRAIMLVDIEPFCTVVPPRIMRVPWPPMPVASVAITTPTTHHPAT